MKKASLMKMLPVKCLAVVLISVSAAVTGDQLVDRTIKESRDQGTRHSEVIHPERRATILLPQRESPRIAYGVKQLRVALEETGLAGIRRRGEAAAADTATIAIGMAGKDKPVAEAPAPGDKAESFTIANPQPGKYFITGRDDAGAMYGCLELAERVLQAGGLPPLATPIFQSPAMRLRETLVYMALPTGSRDGGFYDFLWTPENFPWFYDKKLWTDYLDLMARSRFNTLVFWAGHPFTSILRLPKFPEAQELSGEELGRNIEMFQWVCREADRRGIGIVVHFYNIRISHALAKAHGTTFHLNKPTPLAREYTRHCVSEFIKNYPNVSLIVCLGEYLESEFDAQWLAEVIIPGIKDALRPDQELPPLIVRSHDCPIEEVLARATPIYPNIYTMSKYSSEALTSHLVGGGPGNKDVMSWQFSKDLAQKHLHIIEGMFISNLQPFQYASPRFARGAVQSSLEIGSRGLLLFPILFLYWPNIVDLADPSVRQIDRDWMWFESWGRAAWEPARTEQEERVHWIRRLKETYGTREAAAAQILDACEASGEIMPQVVRTLSNQPWNVQTHTLCQTMEQTIGAGRWYAPAGETIAQFAEKEAAGASHEGESPLMAVGNIRANGDRSLRLGEQAAPHVTRNRDAFDRWLREIHLTKLIGEVYADKTEAAIATLLYLKTHETRRLEEANRHLEASVKTYRELVRRTDGVYASAGDWEATRQLPFRKPVKHWKQVLPLFERELMVFRENARYLREHPGVTLEDIKPYPGTVVTVLTKECRLFKVREGERPYLSMEPFIRLMNPELVGLTGIRIDPDFIKRQSHPIEFELKEPARLFIGFTNSTAAGSVPPPNDWQLYTRGTLLLETAEPGENELNTQDMYRINLSKDRLKDRSGNNPSHLEDLPANPNGLATLDIYMKEFPTGRSVIEFDAGRFVVLGFAKAAAPLVPEMQRHVQRRYLFSRSFAVAQGADTGGRPYPGGKKTEIWVLAGQSNMQGGALPKKKVKLIPRIMVFDPDDKWTVPGEPLQRWWLSQSPVFTNLLGAGLAEFRAQCATNPFQWAGVGPGLFFAQHLIKYIVRPVGLVPCSLGGTSMKQWDPALRDKGGESLYGDMIRRMRLVGCDRITGVLWYQGESDADGGAAVVDVYEKAFLDLIDSIRRDAKRPGLPFIFVQLGRNARAIGDAPRIDWERTREIQRKVSLQRNGVYMVSAIDLELDDELHLSFAAHQRLGPRLAEIALSEVYHKLGHGKPIVLSSIEVTKPQKLIDWRPEESKILVRFKGVSGRLIAPGRPTGFELRLMKSMQPVPWLYKVELDPKAPDTVVLSVRPPYSPWPEPIGLIHGGGFNPYVNIVDEKDIPIPAFGPIPVEIYKP